MRFTAGRRVKPNLDLLMTMETGNRFDNLLPKTLGNGCAAIYAAAGEIADGDRYGTFGKLKPGRRIYVFVKCFSIVLRAYAGRCFAALTAELLRGGAKPTND